MEVKASQFNYSKEEVDGVGLYDVATIGRYLSSARYDSLNNAEKKIPELESGYKISQSW